MTAGMRLRPVHLVTMLSGLLIWSSCFIFLYAALGIGCEIELPGLSILLAGIWLAHLVPIVWLGWRTRQRWRALPEDAPGVERFVVSTTGLVHFSGFIATVWVGAPVLYLPPCT